MAKKPTYKTLPINQQLARRIDDYVIRLLDEAEMASGKMPIEMKIAVLGALGKWVMIKNKLMDVMEGEQLNDLRKRLHADDGPATGHLVKRTSGYRGRGDATAYAGRPDYTAPRSLAELKARVPRPGQHGDDGDRDDGGGEDNPAA